MNEKAYKFSVRDDTSFRVEEGGGSDSGDGNQYSTFQLTVTSAGNSPVEVNAPILADVGQGIGMVIAPLFTVETGTAMETFTGSILGLNGKACLVIKCLSEAATAVIDPVSNATMLDPGSYMITGDVSFTVNNGK